MNTYPFSPRTRTCRPWGLSALLAGLLIITLLLPGGAIGSAQAAPPAQEPPPSRLPYDGAFDLPQRQGVAPHGEVAPALTAPAYVSWSKLVFQSARNEHDWEIYAAQGDGSNQANISNHGSMDLHPRLNRGATRVVFSSNRHGGYDLFAMNPDGGGQTQIVGSAGDDVYPAWSPDGGRIAFQAYRDGQAEIYVANADGSGQTRLTTHGDYDGQPAWSPDGSQIAFVRRESGSYRIWTMNANGSNQRPLSNQPYSENPAWSPDGSQIAYDADGNGDGWQEIWLMNADGGNQREVYNPSESETDAWVGSWSPDGRYVAFTRISFVYYQGQWYWTSAYLDAWDSANPWSTSRLSGNGADWNPDWASTDGQAPTSSVQPLPTQSPATFTVRWTGNDTGGSGLKNYDVQIREGAGGTWTNWKTNTTDTSASYTGVGGRIYYFRARARDHAGNVEAWPAAHDAMTTVESSPPQTGVIALPAFSRNGLLVQWGGSDPGGSGILSYDVQYSQASGAWTDWRTGVTETEATFSGTAGVEYRFRSRARDRAQNVESWPARADAITTLYTWGIGGNVTDNRGAPVASMAASTSPAAFHTAPSDGDGAYAAHVAATAASYSASWSKAGYGALPSTAFAPNPDAAIDVVLPPADNVVQNWGFENGRSSWQFGGSLAAIITDSEKHTGSSAVFLGSETRPLHSIITLPDAPIYPPQGFSAVVDIAGVIHAVWGGSQSKLVYSSKLPTGSWDSADPIPGTVGYVMTGGSGDPVLSIDDSGTVHILWKFIQTRNLFYLQKPAVGEWSTRESVPDTYSPSGTSMAVGSRGTVKVAWCDSGGVKVSERNIDGAWTGAQIISASVPGCHEDIEIATDPAGLAHVLWWPMDPGAGLFYAAEASPGIWLPPVDLLQPSYAINKARIGIDAQGKVHVTWASGNGVYFRSRPAGGQWLPVARLSTNRATDIALVLDYWDTAHLVWAEYGPALPVDRNLVMYTHGTDNTWSPPVTVYQPSQGSYSSRINAVVDSTRAAHVLWLEGYSGSAIRYTNQTAQGEWLPPVEVANPEISSLRGPKLVVDHFGTPHALWQAYLANVYPISYAGPESASTAGEAFVSQVVAVPAAALAPTLSFMHRFGTEFSSNSRIEAAVVDGISTTVVFSATTGSNIWAHQWVDLTPWAGRSVTLRFKVIEAAGGARAWAYIDEVTVGSAHPDAWVSLPAQLAAGPDRAFDTTITYGNRGGVTANGGQVTLQLPAELSFVSADPPPSATAPTLRWDVGTLPAQSEPQTIRVTLQVAASATGGTTVNTSAGITSSTAELEQANNTAAGSVYLGSVRYLPVIMR